jgi:cytoskeletal protein CcmA (bactofilin family)
MFGKSKGDATEKDRNVAPETQRSTIAHSTAPATPDAMSFISSGLSIVGKIVGRGAVTVCGQVEGELQASTIEITEGGQVVGDVVAEDLTIGGRVKGSIHANHVKLNSTAVVEGDILHRSLVIDENARFEGMSRRLENAIDTPSRVQTNRPQPRAGSIDGNGKANGNSKANGAPGAPNL